MRKKSKLNLVLANFWPFPAQTPHFGLISLAAYVKEKMPDVNIKIVEGIDPSREIIRSKPDLVGFTSDTLVYRKTVQKTKQLKKKIKGPFMLGGIHVTALPESFDSVFKVGVVGEGEVTLVKLLKSFRKRRCFSNKDLRKIKGLVFFDKGELIQTGRRELIEDIDRLPYPARDLVPMEEYYLKDQLNLFGVRGLATLMTSRGCSYRCVFCGSPVQWGGVRFHSPEYVVGEIKMLLQKYKIDGIMFWDDLFIAPEERVEKMVALIKKEGLDKKLTFFGYARTNLINKKICYLLKEMNVRRLIFGLESGSEKILGYLKKNSVTVADNKRAIRLCRKYDIAASSGFITGTPGETLGELKKTYEFMKKYPLDNTQIYTLTPYPGTETWRLAEEQKLVSKDMDFSRLFVQLPSLSLFDLLRKSRPSILENKVFLNTKYRNNKKYIDLIFKMHKLAYLQNLSFYLKVFIQDPDLLWRTFRIEVKKIFNQFLGKSTLGVGRE